MSETVTKSEQSTNTATTGRITFGRRTIYTDVEEITAENVVQVLDEVMSVHQKNRSEIEYLHRYYKGRQPILSRTKEIRSDICNKIVENRANEIVSFKVGYLMGEPVQYVSRSEEESNNEALNILNDYVYLDNKNVKDKELAEWFFKCGVAYKMVVPNKKFTKDSADEESPFCTYILDPRNTFVIRKNDLTKDVIGAVKYVVKKDNTVIYGVYTDKFYFEVKDGKVIKNETHECEAVPIIEYAANSAKLGAFEIVLPILDAINIVASNRADGIEQFIQALLVLKGVDITAEDFAKIKELGGLKVPLEGDVEYLIQELNQQQTQTLKDDMYETVLTICGMPNRNGGSSTSDTGKAVIMRDGWSAAEARAKDSEEMYKAAEKEALKIMLRICRVVGDVKIKRSSVNIRFTRRNFENILEKAQVLTMLLNCDKIHPQLAFSHCGMFVDSELAYTMSKEYYDSIVAAGEAQHSSSLTEPTSAETAKEGDDDDNINDAA